MDYELKAARIMLTDVEKDRLVCLFLTIDPATANSLIDWQKAGDALGNASVESLRVVTRNTLKKIKVGNVAADVLDSAANSATPAKPKSTPKKRKVKAGGEQADGEETIIPKKKRARKHKTPAVVQDNDDDDEDEAAEATMLKQIEPEEREDSDEP